MNYANLINNITTHIATNGVQAITAQVLQDVLVDMVQEMGQSGALIGGVIDTSFVPDPTNDAQVVYIAEGEGTYTNFGGLTVGAGELALFDYDGVNWVKHSVNVIEVVDSLSSTATDKALSANMGKALYDAFVQLGQDIYDTELPKKADKVSGATAGHFAGLDADGNLTDSGVAPADKIDKVHDAEVGNVPMFKADGGIEDGGVAADNIAEQDGYYETMVVGAAENLIGRGSVSAEFTRRRAGGGNIGSGAAVLEEIQGNTLVWNQLVDGTFSSTAQWLYNGTTMTVSNNVGTITASSAGSRSIYSNLINGVVGHKYYIAATIKASVAMTGGTGYAGTYRASDWNFSTTFNRFSIIFTGAGTARQLYVYLTATTAGDSIDVKDLVCIDLTQMFGSGNEPSTVAEFEALFPLNYYAYNTGSLLNLTATGLQTDGFNQWDEEWESGKYNTTTGEADDAPTQIRSKNYIPVFGGTNYYFQFPLGVGNLVIMRYDIDKNYLGYNAIQPSVRTLSADTRFIRFYMTVTYGTTYKNDICISLSDVNKNGTYEPYWTETKALPITTATSGGVAIFSDGMKSAGTAHDRYYKSQGSDLFDKAEKVTGVVDLGTLTWTYSSDFRSSSIASLIKAPTATNIVPNIVCSKYAVSKRDSQPNLSIGVTTGGNLVVIDTNYTNAATFKTAMSGVILYYELATPTDYTLDTPFSAQYGVDGMGTETLLPQNTATPTTSPIICEVKYPMNAVDTLRNLPQNYISKASMDAILTAFKTAGVITGYTLTWDATNQKYNCTITP